jgi:hypothetical protein
MLRRPSGTEDPPQPTAELRLEQAHNEQRKRWHDVSSRLRACATDAHREAERQRLDDVATPDNRRRTGQVERRGSIRNYVRHVKSVLLPQQTVNPTMESRSVQSRPSSDPNGSVDNQLRVDPERLLRQVKRDDQNVIALAGGLDWLATIQTRGLNSSREALVGRAWVRAHARTQPNRISLRTLATPSFHRRRRQWTWGL